MIEVFFDGLCEEEYLGGPRNPGGLGCFGFVIKENGKKLAGVSGCLGSRPTMTNNIAEFEALYRALKWLEEKNLLNEKLHIYGDSQLVINQVKGKFQVRSETSKYYVPKIRRLLDGKEAVLEWIPRNENVEADRLSRIAYKKRVPEVLQKMKDNPYWEREIPELLQLKHSEIRYFKNSEKLQFVKLDGSHFFTLSMEEMMSNPEVVDFLYRIFGRWKETVNKCDWERQKRKI